MFFIQMCSISHLFCFDYVIQGIQLLGSYQEESDNDSGMRKFNFLYDISTLKYVDL